MTVRRKPEEETFSIRLGKRDMGWRAALVALVISATPYGKSLLSYAGIVEPASPALLEIKSDVDQIKSKVDSLDRRVDRLEYRVTGFKFDPNRIQPK